MNQIFTPSIILSLTFTLLVTAHEWKLGTCPDVDVVKDFDYSQMVGIWYVIEETKSTSTCTNYEFFQQAHGKKSLKESTRLMGIEIKHVMKRFTQYGPIGVPVAKQPAKMTVAFPYSIVPNSPVDFWIMDTDYSSYAATWSCQSAKVFHRQSAMILSRESTLDQLVINKLRKRFEYFGINTKKLSFISQKNCGYPTDSSASPINPKFTTPSLNPLPSTQIPSTSRSATTTTRPTTTTTTTTTTSRPVTTTTRTTPRLATTTATATLRVSTTTPPFNIDDHNTISDL